MATLVLTAVGTVVGGPIGGAIGAVLGQAVDARLFAPKAREGPRLGELAVQTSSYGTAIPKLFGTMRVAGTVIWSTDLLERRSTSGGGKGRPKTADYSYSASFAVALSGRPVIDVRRIWADGKLLRGEAGDFKSKTRFRLYAGSEDQEVDPLIAAAEGAGGAPAFRGIAYAMFEEMELADFGNRIPSLTFEVVADEGPVPVGAMAQELSGGMLAPGEAPAVAGYAASGDSVRGAIQDLASLLALSVEDDGAQLTIGRAGEEPLALPRASESGRREIVRRAAASVPGEVSITYYDAARDYQAGLQRASVSGGPEARSERRGLPAVLSAPDAKALAEARLDTLAAGRVTADVSCGWSMAHVRAGARVRLEGESGKWRVERWTLGNMNLRLELVREGAGGAAGGAATPGRPVSEPDLLHGPTLLRLHDLPVGEGGISIVALAAGSEAGWRRAELSMSFDDGASWSDIGAAGAPAVLGTAATVLPEGGSALFDLGSTVDVELLSDGMELLSASDDALVSGANLALIGHELIQFGDAEAIGPKRYRLSRLLRGRRGTEWASASHQIGEDFALIEAGSGVPIALPPGFGPGGTVQLLASGVGDEEPAEAELMVTGEALLPPSPVHLRAESLLGGDHLISWVRRSRAGWSWTSGSDTPLGEESEAYRMTFLGDAGTRVIEVGASPFVYTAAARAGDGAGPVEIRLAQVGTHAVSRAAVTTIS